MKHIIKVNDIQDAKDDPTRPLIALDNSGILFFKGKATGPQIEFVDLGLSVKWGKSLLGATNGDTAESWYGNYYAWGEIEPNKTNEDGNIYYDWTNYKYANGAEKTLTKYCNNSYYGDKGFTDELTKLVPEDDVATVTNSAWRMPTKAELDELIALPNIWVANYDPNKTEHTTDDGGIQGLNGRLFTGKNRNTLFIPAAGWCAGSDFWYVGSGCILWASSLGRSAQLACYLAVYSSTIGVNDNAQRNGGCRVCPVC